MINSYRVATVSAMLMLTVVNSAIAQEEIEWMPDLPRLPDMPFEQFEYLTNRFDLIKENHPTEGVLFTLRARVMKSHDVGGDNKHFVDGECLVLQEHWPSKQDTYVLRPFECSDEASLVPGYYIADRIGASNLYVIEGVNIEPSGKAMEQHTLHMFVLERDTDPNSAKFPTKIKLTVKGHTGVTGGGLHPGHARFD